MSRLKKLSISGYKSIHSLKGLELNEINILLGANGAGKSNFISAFKFLANIYDRNLKAYVQMNGGPDLLLYYGRKKLLKCPWHFILAIIATSFL